MDVSKVHRQKRHITQSYAQCCTDVQSAPQLPTQAQAAPHMEEFHQHAKTLAPMARIWHVVAMIPEGKVSSYGKLADLAGLPGRARYVATALKSAPKQLALPWHRVLNHQGRIAFEANSVHFQQQQRLLRDEHVIVVRGKVNLSQFEWRPDMPTLVLALPF